MERSMKLRGVLRIPRSRKRRWVSRSRKPRASRNSDIAGVLLGGKIQEYIDPLSPFLRDFFPSLYFSVVFFGETFILRASINLFAVLSDEGGVWRVACDPPLKKGKARDRVATDDPLKLLHDEP